MFWLFTGIVALLVLWGTSRFIAEGDPRIMARGLKWGGAGIFAAAAILFAVMGRFPLTLMLGGAAAFLLGVPDTFLDRRRPSEDEGHRHQNHRYGRAPSAGAMSQDEAFDVLGLEKGASAEDIKEAHKRLIKQSHPDQGGSDYLASKVNLAKDVLLKSLED